MTADRVDREPSVRRRALFAALFAVYLGLLVWIVLWKLGAPHVGWEGLRRVELVPFGAGVGANAPLEVVANLLLFVPFGVYLGVLAPSWPWWKVAGAAAGTSLALETAQYLLSIGVSDVTDLIVNTAGALTGLALLACARRRLRARTGEVVSRVCTIGTVLALFAAGAFLASPLQFRQPDVRCEVRGDVATCAEPGRAEPAIPASDTLDG